MIPHYEVTGPPGAPVVVLSSSLGTTLDMWQPQLGTLERHFRVVRYDHRGHGRSAVPPGPYRIADLGEDVVELLDHLGLSRVGFAGISLGGMTGIWLAANAPDRVQRLALLCTSAKLGTPEYWDQRAAAVAGGGCAAIAGTVAARWFTPGFHLREPGIVQRYTDMLAATPAAGYAACCAAIATMDLRPELSRINAQALVVAGADDHATPPEHARQIAAGAPDAHVQVIPHAAHLASVEQPDTVAALLLRHFQGES
ncbi:3-oxoadipate enol-lactonase [Phytoactinopolyspora mesophila]|uniref:3-oxoadipate enol-lactonase n=1 Tax=Phytoactinopolyspora mesophila TaxID=2650750 RepID=A0A7K3M0A2_9ACTN|nr:3-oxoadipate enol-lactonase [Phytoactinopolyspora mesophila]NDL56726.1 3-oxoadipate enol-lactonase [Phytoactinopolyspora mesophila]